MADGKIEKKDNTMVDFTLSLIEHLENAERIVRVAITPEGLFKRKCGMLVGKKLNTEEARAFGVVADVLYERANYLKEQQRKKVYEK